jgi:hypothetical protein
MKKMAHSLPSSWPLSVIPRWRSGGFGEQQWTLGHSATHYFRRRHFPGLPMFTESTFPESILGLRAEIRQFPQASGKR